jgi:spore maturation protein CgeB
MKWRLFTHSLLSDWNHGNAHFLRGVVSELVARGHDVQVFEPRGSWSLSHLKQEEQGEEALAAYKSAYPLLQNVSRFYDLQHFDACEAVEGADVVLVHEWSDHDLVAKLGCLRQERNFKLLFHDTHHRAVSKREEMAAYDLRFYDGVLAFGNVIRDLYQSQGWAKRAWTWHEAADTRVFKPSEEKVEFEGDLIWIGNWGDGERTRELHEFLLRPVKKLNLKARVHGVRYPDEAKAALKESGIEYGGWLPNVYAPREFARFKATVHVPRRPYVEALPGIPTIRPFEALACGIPLVSAPWNDVEGLFTPGEDFLVARDGEEMKRHLQVLASDEEARESLANRGLQTVLARHTCAHRVDELLHIVEDI